MDSYLDQFSALFERHNESRKLKQQQQTQIFSEKEENRKGFFTSSQIYKLLSEGRKGETSKTALSYVLEKAHEAAGIELEKFTNEAMKFGNEYELEAIHELEKLLGIEVKYKGGEQVRVAHDRIWLSGKTDGYVHWNKKKYAIEVKCAYNPIIHTKRLHIRDFEGLYKHEKNYAIQTQSHLLLSEFSDFGKCDGVIWVSYSPKHVSRKLKYIVIENEKEIQDTIVEKVELYAPMLHEWTHFLLGAGGDYESLKYKF